MNFYWERFLKTGRIEDYLSYRKAEDGKEFKDGRTYNKNE